MRALWKAHGTKLLGVLVAVAAFADTYMTDILEVIPLGYRPLGKLLICGLAYFVVRRGYTNDRRPGGSDPPIDH